MINDFLKLETAKEKLVKLGASKLANILILIIAGVVAVSTYKDDFREYMVGDIERNMNEFHKGQQELRRGQNEMQRDIRKLKDSVKSMKDGQSRLQRLNHITLDAVLEQKTKVEILEELYKSGMNGWGWTNEKKNSSPCPIPFDLAESIK
jgi:predicted nuclease with TOPRIM domain